MRKCETSLDEIDDPGQIDDPLGEYAQIRMQYKTKNAKLVGIK